MLLTGQTCLGVLKDVYFDHYDGHDVKGQEEYRELFDPSSVTFVILDSYESTGCLEIILMIKTVVDGKWEQTTHTHHLEWNTAIQPTIHN